MIRYANGTREALEALVDAHKSDWRTNAATRTAAIVQAGAFAEKSSIWSEIKLVLMALQNFKCIFCERPLARKLAGAVEQDVEHFRPKSSVKEWPKKPKKNQAPNTPSRQAPPVRRVIIGWRTT
jgi:hypothetical protein